VFQSILDGGSLWKVDAEGHHAMKLVNGRARPQAITPDDRAVVFQSPDGGILSPWIVSIDGGKPRQIMKMFASADSIDVSPDGKSLVLELRDNEGQSTMTLCDLPNCSAQRHLNGLSSLMLPPPLGRTRWAPDGKAITYIDSAGQNLWRFPLGGSPVRQLTRFTDRRIGDFAWSRDGKRLAISRSTTTSDIVLFKGLRR
jgi:Tol biopolymer transport system component